MPVASNGYRRLRRKNPFDRKSGVADMDPFRSVSFKTAGSGSMNIKLQKNDYSFTVIYIRALYFIGS